MASRVLPDEAEWAELAPGPGSITRRKVGDLRLVPASGYALMLQVAHPTVGAGVAEHSDFQQDPFGRLLRTLDYVNGTIYGGPELAGKIGRAVRVMHRTIKGTKPDGERYSALEPEAYAWVHATLAASIVNGHELFGTPFTPAEQVEFWAEWRKVGRLIGVHYRDLPEDWADFQPYVDEVVRTELEHTVAVDMVLEGLERPKRPHRMVPRPVWNVARVPAAFGMRLGLVGLLSPEVRELLGLSLSRGEQRTLAVAARISRASAPLLFGPLGDFGPFYVRQRRSQLEGMDFAARQLEARQGGALKAPARVPINGGSGVEVLRQG
jgi:uncharacterized protein (DUF2236 family)